MANRSESLVRHEVLAEHHQLRDVMESLRDTLRARQTARATVEHLLRDLAQRLVNHFEHEEADGYFAEVIDVAPRLRGRIQALEWEHTAMSERLVKLQACAAGREVNTGWWTALETMFEEFREYFLVHEAAEAELLQQAYGEDIGAKD